MKLQQLYSYTRQALDDYHLIDPDDKIAIGISGGKDSLTLLYALSGLRRFYPVSFEIVAVSVDLGYENFNLEPVQKLCEELHVTYYRIPTEIAKIISERQCQKTSSGSLCSLCAKMRKGALNTAIKELGCNKVAYAHHMDDIIETAFLSMIFEGRFYSFPPKTYLEDIKITVIRPLIYISESKIKGFQNKYKLPVVKNPCPMDGNTKREYVKGLIRQMNLEHPGVKKRLFHAIRTSKLSGWDVNG